MPKSSIAGYIFLAMATILTFAGAFLYTAIYIEDYSYYNDSYGYYEVSWDGVNLWGMGFLCMIAASIALIITVSKSTNPSNVKKLIAGLYSIYVVSQVITLIYAFLIVASYGNWMDISGNATMATVFPIIAIVAVIPFFIISMRRASLEKKVTYQASFYTPTIPAYGAPIYGTPAINQSGIPAQVQKFNCPQCGEVVEDTFAFCTNCRFPLKQAQTQAQTHGDVPVYQEKPIKKGKELDPNTKKCFVFALISIATIIIGLFIGLFDAITFFIYFAKTFTNTILMMLPMIILNSAGITFGILSKMYYSKEKKLESIKNTLIKIGNIFSILGIIINGILLFMAILIGLLIGLTAIP